MTQTVAHGGNADAVTASGLAGYIFDRWLLGAADYGDTNPLTVTNVTADMTLTAIFREALPVDPDGAFVLSIPPDAFPAGLAVWDLSGQYEADLGGDNLALDLLHDSKGKITGDGLYRTDLPVKVTYGIPLLAKGGGKGKDGVVLVKLGLKGAAVGIPGDPAAKAKISAKQTLTLDVGSSTLVGTASVSAAFGKVKDRFTTNVTVDLPPGMDGTYDVALDLAYDGKKVTGTGVLMLSNGVSYPLIVKGKVTDGVTSLGISGDKADPAAGGIKLKASVQTLEGGTARVLSLSGKAFGQSISWPQ